MALALAAIACSGGSREAGEPIVVDDTGSEATTAEDPTGPDHGGDDSNVTVGEDACETDADCVPAECCHPSACVAAANAPDCEDTMCTQECRAGTIDCGGSCVCIDGRCGAQLSPTGGIETDPGPR